MSSRILSTAMACALGVVLQASEALRIDQPLAADHLPDPAADPPRIEIGPDGLRKDGRPAFLLGTIHGSAQCDFKTLHHVRLMGLDFSVPAWYGYMQLVPRGESGGLAVGWRDNSWMATMLAALAEHRLAYWVDIGSDSATTLWRALQPGGRPSWEGGPELRPLAEAINPFHGHFYPIDHTSPAGRSLLTGFQQAMLRQVRPADPAVIAVELFNEVGYNCFSPANRAAFRTFIDGRHPEPAARARILGHQGDPADLPFLAGFLDGGSDALGGNQEVYRTRIGDFQRRLDEAWGRHPLLMHEWSEFLRQRFAQGLGDLARACRDRQRLPVTIQARLQTTDHGPLYETIDPELVARDLDLFGMQISNVRFADYRGQAADETSVKSCLARLALTPDYALAATGRPVVNPECIVEGAFPNESSIAAMLAAPVADLHTAWRFRTDPAQEGAHGGWHLPGCDDRGWGTVAIPNFARDDDRQARTFVGDCWYRLRFTIDARHLRARDFDFKRFVLAGKGLDDRADLWLNGRQVFSGGSWNSTYAVDVTADLRYGEENVLAARVTNTTGLGGIRDYITICDRDSLRQRAPLSAGQTAALVWQHAIHGFSGLDFWLTNEPIVNPPLAPIRQAIGQVADLLAAGDPVGDRPVALLYPFESLHGLGHSHDPDGSFAGVMDWYAAALFRQTPARILTCRQIAAGAHRRHPVLLAPRCRLVRSGVFAAAVEHARAGGTLVITADSFQHEEPTYARPPVEALLDPATAEAWPGGTTAYRVGSGRVVLAPEAPGIAAAGTILGRILEQSGHRDRVRVDWAAGAEPALVEVQVRGTPGNLLVYAMNWGGLPQQGTLRIAAGLLGPGPVRIRDAATGATLAVGGATGADLEAGGIPLAAPAQEPRILLLESGTPRALRSCAEGRMAALTKLAAWSALAPDGGREGFDAAWIAPPGHPSPHFDAGIADTPCVADLLAAGGARIRHLAAADLDDRGLAGIELLIVHEDYAFMWKELARTNPGAYAAIRRHLERGGSLLLTAIPAIGVNAQSLALREILGGDGLSVPGRTRQGLGPAWFRSTAGGHGGDPNQVLFTAIAEHPITAGVQAVSALIACPIRDRRGLLQAVVSAGADEAAFPGEAFIRAGSIGTGRVVVAGDASFMQPVFIERRDNLRLTWNILRWLADGRLPERQLPELRAALTLTAAGFADWERSEGR
jgi:hypothetical protein